MFWARTTFVLHELEPDLFLENDPEHFAEFGDHVRKHLKDLDDDEMEAQQHDAHMKASSKRSEKDARKSGVMAGHETVDSHEFVV